MLEEKRKKLKEMFFFKSDKSNKKKIENLVVFIIILIITVILINTIWNGDKKTKQNTVESTDKILAEKKQIIQTENNKTDSIELEERLENMLQNIEGVGKAKVLLTYSESSQVLAMYNEDSTQNDTEETDTRRTEVEK